MLKLEDVCHSYFQSSILQNITFNFDCKKYVLVGPSGVGKSTLLHIAAGILSPTSGTIKCDVKRGVVFQSLNLLADFTLRENIEIIQAMNLSSYNYDEIIEITCIADQLDKFPNQLSGGQNQRGAIAKALAFGAQFILADEPTGSLDPENAKIIRNLFDFLHQKLNIGMLISTHDYAWLSHADIKLKLENGALCSFH